MNLTFEFFNFFQTLFYFFFFQTLFKLFFFSLISRSKKRESVPDLAPILWHSFGTIACLLQEIVAIYPLLSPPKLKAPSSNRVCNALALLQCVASHPETRALFLGGKQNHFS